MGIFRSTKLKCPKKYDKRKFGSIVQLFHQLDEDGDRVLRLDDLKSICEPYFVHEIENLKNKIERSNNLEKKMVMLMCEDFESEMSMYEKKCRRKNKDDELTKSQKENLIDMELKSQGRMTSLKNEMEAERTRMELDIKLFKSYNKDDKLLRLMEDFIGDPKEDGEIEFKHFFNLLKNKDITDMVESG